MCELCWCELFTPLASHLQGVNLALCWLYSLLHTLSVSLLTVSVPLWWLVILPGALVDFMCDLSPVTNVVRSVEDSTSSKVTLCLSWIKALASLYRFAIVCQCDWAEFSSSLWRTCLKSCCYEARQWFHCTSPLCWLEFLVRWPSHDNICQREQSKSPDQSRCWYAWRVNVTVAWEGSMV